MLPSKRWIAKVSPEGYKYSVWEMPLPMNVPPNWLDCSFYVYKTVQDAKAGTHSGGSGCLVCVPSKHRAWFHVYAVTNRHVLDKGYGVLRLNTFEGKTSTIETQWADWETLEESGDVAVKPISLGPGLRWRAIHIEEFMSRETMEEFCIWPGSEAFMIGRLINQSGRQRNTPVVRFGNLSMLADPTEPVNMGDYGEHEAFLIECRSLSGFSGSPVFLTSTQIIQPRDGEMPQGRLYSSGPVISIDRVIMEQPSTGGTDKVKNLLLQGTFGPWFIGIDRGHVPLWKPVLEKDQETDTGHRVEQNTGIAVVIPAWRIMDVLNKEELVKQRTEDDEEIGKRKQTASIADVGEEDNQPFTQSDFESALKKASRKIPSSRSDEEKK
jgi:hypothetical protein